MYIFSSLFGIAFLENSRKEKEVYRTFQSSFVRQIFAYVKSFWLSKVDWIDNETKQVKSDIPCRLLNICCYRLTAYIYSIHVKGYRLSSLFELFEFQWNFSRGFYSVFRIQRSDGFNYCPPYFIFSSSFMDYTLYKDITKQRVLLKVQERYRVYRS